MRTHDEIAELLGAYALDAVEADERAAIEDHLSTCVRCRAEVQEHREVASLLAHGGADAPDGLWDRIAGSLEAPPPQLDLAPVVPLRTRRLKQAAVALVAAAAVLLALLGVQVGRQDDRINELEAALRNPMAPAFHDALADPSSEVIDLKAADGHVVGRVAITADGTAFLGGNTLAALAENRTYQLWGQAGDELVSLAVLGNRPAIVTFPASRYSLFAITEEVAGGVVQTENAPVATGSVTA
jgi:hypothetical protein